MVCTECNESCFGCGCVLPELSPCLQLWAAGMAGVLQGRTAGTGQSTRLAAGNWCLLLALCQGSQPGHGHGPARAGV